MTKKICNTCLYWSRDPKETKPIGTCMKMQNCFCCHSDRQIAGAVGGGTFKSFGTFGCNMWRIDSRANR